MKQSPREATQQADTVEMDRSINQSINRPVGRTGTEKGCNVGRSAVWPDTSAHRRSVPNKAVSRCAFIHVPKSQCGWLLARQRQLLLPRTLMCYLYWEPILSRVQRHSEEATKKGAAVRRLSSQRRKTEGGTTIVTKTDKQRLRLPCQKDCCTK